jgi:UDP-GlcNAc:undecaprenyl-phosphate GlcNAc-1-phosphate transferase
VANVEMRFLWLALATAILVATMVVLRRRQQEELAERRQLAARPSDPAVSETVAHPGGCTAPQSHE